MHPVQAITTRYGCYARFVTTLLSATRSAVPAQTVVTACCDGTWFIGVAQCGMPVTSRASPQPVLAPPPYGRTLRGC